MNFIAMMYYLCFELPINGIIGDTCAAQFVEQGNHVDVCADTQGLQVHVVGFEHHVHILRLHVRILWQIHHDWALIVDEVANIVQISAQISLIQGKNQ
jgi:hypothetical protein